MGKGKRKRGTRPVLVTNDNTFLLRMGRGLV